MEKNDWKLTIPHGGFASRSMTYAYDDGTPYDLTDHTVAMEIAASYDAIPIAWTAEIIDAAEGIINVTLDAAGVAAGLYVGTLWLVDPNQLKTVLAYIRCLVRPTVEVPAP